MVIIIIFYFYYGFFSHVNLKNIHARACVQEQKNDNITSIPEHDYDLGYLDGDVRFVCNNITFFFYIHKYCNRIPDVLIAGIYHYYYYNYCVRTR